MLSAHHLNKTYGIHTVLQDITFTINPGERLGLVGQNGCGKTTLLRILTGQEQPDSGVVAHAPGPADRLPEPGLRPRSNPDPRRGLHTRRAKGSRNRPG